MLLAAVAADVTAATADDVRIYINPGHGGWGPNDRPMATIPYPNLSSTGRPDTCGFYESNTNLWKGLEMRNALRRMGVQDNNITLSRTANGPYPYDGNTFGLYSKSLSVIAAEVEEGDYDMFVSIHSNALTDGTPTNYPLYLYRGTNDSEAVAGSKAMCQASWPRHWMNEVDPTSGNWSRTNTVIRGDVTFYGSGSNSTNSASGNTYYGYLGVLKHSTPGFLVEGFFHTYHPARHRALNQDYCRQEGIRLARGAADYFGIAGESTGYIMGSVKDAVNSLENSLYAYSAGTIDAHAPINGATVNLYKSGTLVGTYKTDNNYNGIFVFSCLAPGNDYTVSVTANGYQSLADQTAYSVSANETTYMVLYMEGESSTVTKPKGIFAYGLNRASDDDGNYVFYFKCNSVATDAYLVFCDSTTGDEVGRIKLSNIVEGDNTITLSPEDLPGDDGQVLSWAVNVVGETITGIERINDVHATYTRAMLAIDRSPESAHFGTIYVGERVASQNASNGLWACDVEGKPTHSTVYNGGQTWANNMRLAVDGEGKVYIPEWGDATSGIYIADPDDLGGTFKQFFVGTRNSSGLITNNGVNVGSSVPSVWIQGTGADTRLYAFLEDLAGPSGKANGVGIYNIGQHDGSLATSWDKAPDNYLDIGALMLNGNGNIIADPGGRGTWVMQYRSKGQNLSSVPSLVFVDNGGNVVFNSGLDLSSLNGSMISGYAINNTNDMMVINDGDGVLQFYNIAWNGNIPVLTANGMTFVADARTSNNVIYQMSFDWGGNLVCSGKNVGIYSIPTNDNQSTTPARTALSVVKRPGYLLGDVNGDGIVNISDVTALINYLLGSQATSINTDAADINNSDSINISDVTSLINLLLKG